MAIFGDDFTGTLQNKEKHTYNLTASQDGEVRFDFARSSGTSDRIDIELKDHLGNTVIKKSVKDVAEFFATVGKGDYTLIVSDGLPYQQSVDTYTLATTFKHESDVTYDTGLNDVRENATSASLGSTIVGSLTDGDKDFFVLTAPTGGKLSFNFLHPYPESASSLNAAPIFIRVTDEARNLLVQERLSASGLIETTVAYAGKYFFEISDAWPSRQNDGGIYRLESTFTTKPHTTYDGGHNNTSGTAMSTAANRPVVGALAEEDVDFFKMRAETGGQLNVSFAHPDGFGKSEVPIRFTVLDSNGAVVLEKMIAGSGMFSAQLGGAGDYYIKLAPPIGYYKNMKVYEFIPTVTNGQGDDLVLGGDEGELFLATSGNDTINGNGGLDMASFSGKRSEFSLTTSAAGVVVDGASGRDVLLNVERVRFDDVDVEFSDDGVAADVYMLYEAAFDREPDKEGLGFWISATDKGTGISTIARYFTQSDEFKAIYGESPTNAELVNRLYWHILDREPDSEGRDYWIAALDSGTVDQAGALHLIAISDENHTQVIGKIANGIEFIPYG